MVLKLVSKDRVTSDAFASTRVVYKKSWSFRAALETIVFFALMMGAVALMLLTFNNGGPVTSPELRKSIILIGVAVALGLSMLVCSVSQQKHFLSSLCKQYGYTLESFSENIIDEDPDTIESRTLLPVSPVMSSNVDIYVRRTKAGIFVEEIRH